jgi:hypothetical protein
MSELDKLIDEPGDHALRAAVELWRNALGQRSDLGDAHEHLSEISGKRTAARQFLFR